MASLINAVLGHFCLVLLFISMVVAPASAASQSVDWSLGTDYTSFTSSNSFVVGDKLVFKYGAGHTVDEVTKSDYQSCTIGNSISSDSSGTTSITLKTPGTHYFICAIPGHCSGGMKLAVTVASGGGSSGIDSTATPTTTPSSSSGSTDSPTTTSTPTTEGVYRPASGFSGGVGVLPSLEALVVAFIAASVCFGAV